MLPLYVDDDIWNHSFLFLFSLAILIVLVVPQIVVVHQLSSLVSIMGPRKRFVHSTRSLSYREEMTIEKNKGDLKHRYALILNFFFFFWVRTW